MLSMICDASTVSQFRPKGKNFLFCFILSRFFMSSSTIIPSTPSNGVVSLFSKDVLSSNVNSACAKYSDRDCPYKIATSSRVSILFPSELKNSGPWTPENPPLKLFPTKRYCS